MPHLFDPFSLRGVSLRNRIGVSPMCMYSAQNGLANDWHFTHLGARAVGGAALVIAEATAVEPCGRISPNDLGLWEDAQIEPLARINHFVKAHGAVPGIQLAHAGRKASTHRPWGSDEVGPLSPDDPRAWPVVGPSPIAFSEGYPEPHKLSTSEIQSIQSLFCAAAGRALAAGFEWLEIHAAHGYLLHSFYSPLSNQRSDAYGGSFENRVRFLIETVRAVRGVWPDRLPLTVRLSCTDWVETGWSGSDSIALAGLLKAEGVDLIDCSSGGNAAMVPVPVGPGYQVPYSETIRNKTGIATAAVGMITSPPQADEIIRNGRADIVLLGREFLRDPYWPLHAAQALKKPAPVPGQYLRAY